MTQKSIDIESLFSNEANTKKFIQPLYLGAILNIPWMWLAQAIVPNVVEPLWFRLSLSFCLFICGWLASRESQKKHVEIWYLIAVTYTSFVNQMLATWNQFHTFYIVVLVLCLVSSMTTFSKKWAIGIYGIYTVGGVLIGPSQPTFLNSRVSAFATLATVAMVSVIQYVERFKMLEALKQQTAILKEEKRFSQMVTDAVPSFILVTDLESKTPIFTNDRFQEVMGYAREDIPAFYARWEESIHPEDMPHFGPKIFELMASTTPMSFEAEYRLKHKDGHWVWISGYWSALSRKEDGSVQQVMVVAEDITQQKALEAQVLEDRARLEFSAKMSTLGEMASGIAHEINNPLAIIAASMEQLEDQSAQFETVKVESVLPPVKKIRRMVERIATIVRGLRTFAREGSRDAMELILPGAVIHDALEFCQARFQNHGIELKIQIPEQGVSRIRGRGVQLSQVMLNLLNNAFDAVNTSSQKWVQISIDEGHDNQLGRVARFSVKDSGKGVSPSIRDRVMEPFFTTKDPGKGTGLGLSIAHSIVKEHSGRIFYNAESPDTEFVVEIPLA